MFQLIQKNVQKEKCLFILLKLNRGVYMKKTKYSLVFGFIFLLFFLINSKTYAEVVTIDSKPNPDFAITYENTQFGLPSEFISQNPTINNKSFETIVSTVLDGTASESGNGWDKMNFDGTIVQNDGLPYFGVSTSSDATLISGNGFGPGVYKAYFKASTGSNSTLFPVTYYIFYNISLTANPMTIMQGDTWNSADVEVNGSDGLNNPITSISPGLSIQEDVDTSIPGTYPITYTFNDPANVYGIKSVSTTVTVVPKPTIIAPDFPDTTIGKTINVSSGIIEDRANLGNGFVTSTKVQNMNGELLDLNEDGTFTPISSGIYTIYYSYDFIKPNGQSETIIASTTLKVLDIPVIVPAPVNVYYLDEQGNEIAKTVILNGSIGDSYEAEEIKIDGYTLKEVQGNRTGSFSDSEQVVKFIYMKNKEEIEPTQPTQPTQPTHMENIPTSSPSAPPIGTEKKVDSIPKLGEGQSNILAIFIGVVMVIGSTYYLKKRKAFN